MSNLGNVGRKTGETFGYIGGVPFQGTGQLFKVLGDAGKQSLYGYGNMARSGLRSVGTAVPVARPVFDFLGNVTGYTLSRAGNGVKHVGNFGNYTSRSGETASHPVFNGTGRVVGGFGNGASSVFKRNNKKVNT